MQTSLMLEKCAAIRSGPTSSESDSVIQYKVLGLPTGEQAWIAEFDNHWQILRANKEGQGDWTGDYKTAEDALASLQREIRAA
jgi:hypothetical protein